MMYQYQYGLSGAYVLVKYSVLKMPHPFGNEHNAICWTETGILFVCEITKGNGESCKILRADSVTNVILGLFIHLTKSFHQCACYVVFDICVKHL